MVLNEKHRKAIQLYVDGEKKQDIAKKCGVSRQAIYNWLEDEEFLAEVDRQMSKIKSKADRSLTTNINTYIDEIKNLATTAKSEKVRLTANIYILDRVLGKATTKIETKDTTNENDDLSWDSLTNVVELKEVK